MKLIPVPAVTLAAVSIATAQVSLVPLGSYRPAGDPAGLFGQSAAEIVKHDPVSQRLFVVNAMSDAIDVLDIADPGNPAMACSIGLADWGSPNSVDVNPDPERNEIAVAVENGAGKQLDGFVVFFDTDGNYLGQAGAGALPDMVTYTNSGNMVVVANEGEPNSDYSVDPEGSVMLIDVSRGPARAKSKEIKFNDVKKSLIPAIRITGPEGTSVAQDLEPEYVAISPDDSTAYVTLQENNAIAVIDLKQKRLTGVYGLGAKDHSIPGFGLDASNRDGTINIANWPVLGLFMPDSIAAYSAGGAVYLVTANEGDSREYGDYIDEERIKDIELDPAAFPLADALQENENLGRLKMVSTEGDIDGDGDYDELYSFGARSFSIWTEKAELVFDSGDIIERKLAKLYPENFNSTNDEGPSFDNRSDDKGPEVEGLAIGVLDGRTYLFVGLERMGGIMVFDVTEPAASFYVTYFNNRNFGAEFEEGDLGQFGDAGDLGPEGLAFIPAADSPTGEALLAVGNEVSGTTTIYRVSLD